MIIYLLYNFVRLKWILSNGLCKIIFSSYIDNCDYSIWKYVVVLYIPSETSCLIYIFKNKAFGGDKSPNIKSLWWWHKVTVYTCVAETFQWRLATCESRNQRQSIGGDCKFPKICGFLRSSLCRHEFQKY